MSSRFSAPIKSVLISGNLNSDLIYKLYPSTEFSEGGWNMTISSIAYTFNNDIVLKELCAISSNLVKSQKLNKNSEIETYEQPFLLFLLENSRTNHHKIINFGIL